MVIQYYFRPHMNTLTSSNGLFFDNVILLEAQGNGSLEFPSLVNPVQHC